eukprot:CAMPEP_0114599466 /NCGR_PEP_ID=MMETSP0125-20121206/22006_1 /TAXON_ID=485358 ORGANISM="Aristerostoma sp., Strain ATCC 50986" /NCGR_SAMPLE_ID=MMETSP0125 /ASSEMBLY_ACC=CAM_ASM_000245 /LENGTH=129 /DNA_ID=CAMNT_0001806565 /DNA_START=504 /DNA_END=890 /DNA_ORIENTATION=+
MQYVVKFGLETEDDYPYQGFKDSCRYDNTKNISVNTNCNCIEPKSRDQLKAAVAAQPTSIVVEANNIGGSCGAKVDHAVLAVGYTNVDGKDAWIVKNSWGTNWGNSGYLYIDMTASYNEGLGACGIYTG